ncbi:lipoprotein [Rufibacter sp. LB8]
MTVSMTVLLSGCGRKGSRQ